MKALASAHPLPAIESIPVDKTRIAYCCCLGVVALLTTEFGVIGMLPQIAAHYAISSAQAGWLLSAFALVIAVFGPFMTLLTRRFNRKGLLLASLGLFLFAGLVSAAAPPFWLLLLVRVLPAVLHPVFYATSLGLVNTNSPGSEGPRLMAIVLSGIGIATVTTIPLTTYVASEFSWQASFGLQAIVSSLAMLVIAWGVPSLPVLKAPTYRGQLGVLARPAFWWGAGLVFLLVAGWFTTYAYFADYLGQVKHLPARAISYQLLLFGLTGLLGNWLAGKLLSWNLRVTTVLLLAGPVLVALGLYSAAAALAPSTLLVAVWGFWYAPCYLLGSALVSAAAPEAVEFANSLGASFTNLGITVGTTVGGWVIGYQGLPNLPWAGLVFGGAALLVVGLQLVSGRDRPRGSVPYTS